MRKREAAAEFFNFKSVKLIVKLFKMLIEGNKRETIQIQLQ